MHKKDNILYQRGDYSFKYCIREEREKRKKEVGDRNRNLNVKEVQWVKKYTWKKEIRRLPEVEKILPVQMYVDNKS